MFIRFLSKMSPLVFLGAVAFFLFAETAWAGFSDVRGNHWAAKEINEMSQRGVVGGYTDGTFKPDQTVTQVEAVCMAVRAMSLDVLKDGSLPQPSFEIPNWAQDDVKLALHHGLMKNDEQFNANAGASRAWVARLLVRIIGEEERVGQEVLMPNFTDTYQIPDWAVYYVRLAQDNNLLAGYSDNTFRPNNTVSRAEMAAFLSRTDKQLPGSTTGYLSGTVVEAGLSLITIRGDDGQSHTYNIPSTLKVYEGSGTIQIYELEQYDRVKLLADGTTLKYLERVQGQQGNIVSGQVIKVYPERNTFVINDLTDGTRTLSLPDNIPVNVEGSSASGLNALRSGDNVVVTLNAAGYAINIVVNSRSGVGEDRGVVYDIDLDLQPGLITIEYDDSDMVSYQLAEQVAIIKEGVRFPTLQDVHNGDLVRITRDNDLVSAIEVLEENARLDITGKVMLLNTVSNIINLDVDGALKAYRLANRVSVTVPGLASAYLSDVKVGDTVRAQGNKSEINSLHVTGRDAGSSLMATIRAVDTNNRVLTLERNDGTIVAYEVLDEARIIINDEEESLGDLEQDMDVSIRLMDGDVIYVQVDKSAGGIITDLDRDGLLLVFQRENGERKTYLIDDNVDVESQDSRDELKDINNGDYARLVIENNRITEIYLRYDTICQVESVREVYDRLDVVDEDGDSVRLYVRNDVDLLVPGVSYPDLDDVRVGDLVRATYMGRDLDRVEVLEPVRGEITAMDIYLKTVTIREFGGKTTKLSFSAGSKVVSGSRIYNSFSSLTLGERVEVVENFGGGYTFNILKKVSGKLATGVDDDDEVIYLEDGLHWKAYNVNESVYIHDSRGDLSYQEQLKVGDQVQLYILRDAIYEVQI